MLAKLTFCGASLMPRITPVSCTGKKPLGTTMKSRIVRDKRGDGDQQRGESMAQDHLQRAAVEGDDAVEDLLGPVVEAALLVLGLVPAGCASTSSA